MIKFLKYFPGFNCGSCGYSRCDIFAKACLDNQVSLEKCPFLRQERFQKNKEKLIDLLKTNNGCRGCNECAEAQKIVGLIDKYEADFILKPLKKENSCREILLPMTNLDLKEGMVIRYRPIGCPITHFAKILEKNHNLITVHIVGPRNRLQEKFEFTDVGLCMVIGFKGSIEGELPFVGQTVRFLPHHCMMQKIHSGVVVQLEGRDVFIEGVDLKVWAPPIKV